MLVQKSKETHVQKSTDDKSGPYYSNSNNINNNQLTLKSEPIQDEAETTNGLLVTTTTDLRANSPSSEHLKNSTKSFSTKNNVFTKLLSSKGHESFSLYNQAYSTKMKQRTTEKSVFNCISRTNGITSERNGLRRVAVVEDFLRIIYKVHVEMDGRGGKHAGQKRTYRAVSIHLKN